MRLVLASASPRRQQLLRSIGLEFRAVPPDVDETDHAGESPVAYVVRIARAKVDAVAALVGPDDIGDVVVLAADTTVDVDGAILAKPRDDDDARRMLRLLSGRTHQVHTAVVGRVVGRPGHPPGDAPVDAPLDPPVDTVHAVTVTTDVTFARLSDAGVEWYLALGEHLDKAGAYGMQTAGGALVHRIDGSPSNVVGLPLVETIGILRACGLDATASPPARKCD
jgi:septum formation protein